jgi:hypothetical protein
VSKSSLYDIYFSGALTSYRQKLVDLLRANGLRVFLERGFVDHNIRRKNLQKCLCQITLPQDPTWSWLSTMRVTFGLYNSRFTLVPYNPNPTLLDDYVLFVSAMTLNRNSLRLLLSEHYAHLMARPVPPNPSDGYSTFCSFVSSPLTVYQSLYI